MPTPNILHLVTEDDPLRFAAWFLLPGRA